MWKKILLILGLITVLVAPVNAQSVSLGPQVGYYKAQDADGNFMGGVGLAIQVYTTVWSRSIHQLSSGKICE